MYAKSFASSTLTPALASDELFSGLSHIKFMNQLSEIADLTEVATKLEQLAAVAIHQSSLRVAVTCGEEAVNDNIKYLSNFIGTLPTDTTIKASSAEVSPLDLLSGLTHAPPFFLAGHTVWT